MPVLHLGNPYVVFLSSDQYYTNFISLLDVSNLMNLWSLGLWWSIFTSSAFYKSDVIKKNTSRIQIGIYDQLVKSTTLFD